MPQKLDKPIMNAGTVVFVFLVCWGIAAATGYDGITSLARGDTTNGRPMTIIAVLMAGFPFVMLWLYLRTREYYRRRAAAPDAPWTWLAAWDGGEVESLWGERLWRVWIPAVLVTAIAVGTLGIWVRSGMVGVNFGTGVSLVLAVVAVVLIARARRETRRVRAQARPVLDLGEVPWRPGHRVEARVLIPVAVDDPAGFTLALHCGKWRVVGKHRQWGSVWSSETHGVVPTVHLQNTVVPMAWDLPMDQPGTELFGAGSRRWEWRVRATATMADGEPFEAWFMVPVFDD